PPTPRTTDPQMSERRPGVGVIIGMLGGNAESVETFRAAVGKRIVRLWLDATANGGDGALRFRFEDGTGMMLADGGRSCCESRYAHTDDDLTYHVGAELLSAEVRDGPTQTGEWGDEHETAFLHVTTSKGTFVVNT